jgi:hypothetical protein
MGFKGNIGFLRFLRPLGAPGHRNFLNRSSRGFQRLHGRLSFLHRRLIGSCIFNRRSSGSIPFRALIITAKKERGNRFYTTRKVESKHNKGIKVTENLR